MENNISNKDRRVGRSQSVRRQLVAATTASGENLDANAELRSLGPDTQPSRLATPSPRSDSENATTSSITSYKTGSSHSSATKNKNKHKNNKNNKKQNTKIENHKKENKKYSSRGGAHVTSGHTSKKLSDNEISSKVLQEHIILQDVIIDKLQDELDGHINIEKVPNKNESPEDPLLIKERLPNHQRFIDDDSTTRNWSLFMGYMLHSHRSGDNSQKDISKMHQSVNLWLYRANIPTYDYNVEKAHNIIDEYTTAKKPSSKLYGITYRRVGWFALGPIVGCVVYYITRLWVHSIVLTIIIILASVGISLYRPRQRNIHAPCIVEVVQEYQDWCSNKMYTLKADHAEVRYSTIKCVPNLKPVGFTIAIDHIWTPRNCSHNLSHALVHRQCLPPKGTLQSRKSFWGFDPREICHNEVVIPEYPEESELLEMWMDNQTAANRRVYQALLTNCAWSAIEVNRRQKGFAKIEVMMDKPFAKRIPRFINSPDPTFKLAMSPRIWFFTEYRKKAWWGSFEHIIQSPYICTSGMDPVMKGCIVSYYETLGYYAVYTDFKKFDSSNEMEALEAQWDYYTMHKAFCQHFRDEYLFEWRKGTSNVGVSFKYRAKVPSGFPDTSVGNADKHYLWFQRSMCNITHRDPKEVHKLCRLMDDGDDGVEFFHPRIWKPTLPQELKKQADLAGYDWEYEVCNPDQYDNIEYCSGHFWRVNTGVRVHLPKIGRTLAKTFMPVKIPPIRKQVEKYVQHPTDYDLLQYHIYQVAYGMRHYHFMPVLGDVIKIILDKNSKRTCRAYSPSYHTRLLEALDDVDEDIVEEYFQNMYGVSSAIYRFVLDIDWSLPHRSYRSPWFDHLLEVESGKSHLPDTYNIIVSQEGPSRINPRDIIIHNNPTTGWFARLRSWATRT